MCVCVYVLYVCVCMYVCCMCAFKCHFAGALQGQHKWSVKCWQRCCCCCCHYCCCCCCCCALIANEHEHLDDLMRRPFASHLTSWQHFQMEPKAATATTERNDWKTCCPCLYHTLSLSLYLPHTVCPALCARSLAPYLSLPTSFSTSYLLSSSSLSYCLLQFCHKANLQPSSIGGSGSNRLYIKQTLVYGHAQQHPHSPPCRR